MQAGIRHDDGVLVIEARFENPLPEATEPQGNLALVQRILQLASAREDAAETGSIAFSEPHWNGDVLTVDVRLSGLSARAVGSTISATSSALETARRALRRIGLRATAEDTAETEVRELVEQLSERELATGPARAIADHLRRLASSSALLEAARRGLTLRACGWQRLQFA